MDNGIKRLSFMMILVIGLLLCSASCASAHFNFALTDKWSMEHIQPNNVQIIWGHPYEGIYFDAPNMTDSQILKPDGTTSSLTPTEITVEGNRAWELSFTPDIKGDYIVCADFKALVVEEEEVAWEDHVKAIVHYKTSDGWDQTTGQIIEIIPLTRPYGLEEGFVFVGKAIYNGAPLADAPIEIEKYYPVDQVPDPLPEEPMITRETKTDGEGIFMFTLDEPGLWVVCVSHTVGTVEGYDRDIRGILMVPVKESFPAESDEDADSDPHELSFKVDSLEKLVWFSTGVAIIAIIIGLVGIFRGKKK
jgi:cobalt/nickel transport protein